MNTTLYTLVRWGLLLSMALLTACASLPTGYEKQYSDAIRDTADTTLAKTAAPLLASNLGKTGFYVLSDGVDAMGARLVLAQRAEVAIEVQYYYVLTDITGKLLVKELLDAANRGVRVRILLDDISTNGYDLHTLTAARSAGVSIDKVTKDMRQGSKVLNFGSLYGMRSKALASTTTQTYGVPMSEAEAEMALHKFSTTYPQLAEWQRAKRTQARNTRSVYSKSGLARDFNALPAGNMDAEAMNMPVQATGAEILLASLRRLRYPLASTVHDEITIIAPEGKAEEAKAHLNEAMVEGFTEILSEHDQLLNGLVDIKTGYNWAEVH